MRQKRLIANWKMNADFISIKKFISTFSEIEEVETIVCPSYLGLVPTVNFAANKRLKVAAQNASVHSLGHHTGSVSWVELKDYGVKTVMVGHPDVKRDFNESYFQTNQKIQKFLRNGLKVIVFITENKIDFTSKVTKEALKLQMNQLFEGLNQFEIVDNLYIVYKPTFVTEMGIRANSDFVVDTITLIRSFLRDKFNYYTGNNLPIIYGGDLLSEDLETICNNDNIDGILIEDERAISGKFMSLVNKYLFNASTEAYLTHYDRNVLVDEPTELKRVDDQKAAPSFDEYDVDPEVYFKEITFNEEDI